MKPLFPSVTLSLALALGVSLSSATAAQDDARIAAAEAYINTDVQQSLLDDILSPQGVMAQMGLLESQVPQETLDRLAVIISEELATVRPVMESAMIQGMADTFTLAEIEALNAFYTSEEGASAMRKMTPFMATTMQSIAPELQQMQASLARRIQDELSQ